MSETMTSDILFTAVVTQRWREGVFTGVVTQRWEALVTSPLAGGGVY
jgi:hypothetical protein